MLGKLADLARVAAELRVTHAIVAMPAVSHRVRHNALRLATEAGLKVMTVPSFDDIVSGKVTVSQLREVELDDLLGRDPVVLDGAGLSGLLSDAPVMVTGAGGSIGSELCRQIARFRPASLILFEVSEFALYRIEQELLAANPDLRIVCAIGDVRNSARVEQILRDLSTTHSVPCGGIQARAADGRGERVGGNAEQRAWHLCRGGRRGQGRGADLRSHLHRQGDQPGRM